MTDKLRELAERWAVRMDRNAKYATALMPDDSAELAEIIRAYISVIDAEGDGGAVAWIDGAPNKIYASEWFIAQTTNRERVVLTALPEEYTYDFKTADETYIMRSNIKRWMQFPDSQFIPYTETHPARSGVVSDEDVDAAIEVFQYHKLNSLPYRQCMRAALEHFAKGEHHER